ncbi:hypothetical protein ATE92_2074 [Ulvibacter sp. MAR_2010_11]|nr:hypothetical protein ATE92_2074 [Ulvibacter sp. MAR_2010_11]
MTLTAQSIEQLVGHWQLQKVGLKKTIVQNSENEREALLDIFKTGFYNQLTEEQKLTVEDLEFTNSEAEKLLDYYFQTTIEFKTTGAFYNTSQNPVKSLSGEYLLDKKKLHLEWETAEKKSFKIAKNSNSELILKDTKLKITYYYLKINPIKIP